MKARRVHFRLQFASSEIRRLAKLYSYDGEGDALGAGREILHRRYSRANLEVIFRWKTKGRGISRLRRNTDLEIADSLRLAVAARAERSALAVLMGLSGIHVAVGSAILTAIFPKRYTIIDFRALDALGVKRPVVVTIELYLAYLCHCRHLAKQNNVTLRCLDRALWQWSKEQTRAD